VRALYVLQKSMIPQIPDDYPGAIVLRVIGWSLISSMVIANLLCLLSFIQSQRDFSLGPRILNIGAITSTGFALLILTPIMILLALDGFGSQGSLVTALWVWHILLMLFSIRRIRLAANEEAEQAAP
jgi:Na+-transporting NADH:ubiquinone oxidoreductase subunit NqrC